MIWLVLLSLSSIEAATKQKNLTLAENSPVGTTILSLNKAFYEGDKVKRRFSVQQTRRNIVQVDDNGNVQLATEIDHEKCSAVKCVFKQTIMVMPQEVFERIELYITILDENDNTPKFLSSKVQISVRESNLPGQEIEVPELIARDADMNAKLTYSILDNNKFGIHEEDGRVYISIRQILDHESTNFEYATVGVRDEANHQTTTKLVVKILDKNDHSPKFRQDRFMIEIGEKVETGVFIHEVVARDEDTGDNGLITYQIVSVEPKQASGLFRIAPVTGTITNARSILRQEFEMIKLKILAQDSGIPALSSIAEIDIRIMDSKDHSPTVNLTPVTIGTENQESVAVVMENATIGSFVLWYYVSDNYNGENGAAEVAIEPSDIFGLNKKDGAVVSKQQFDREVTQSYELTVSACSNGVPKRCTKKSMRVKIADVNDNKPVMSESSIDVSFPEDLQLGTILFSVSAEDADDPAGFGKISYSLEEEKSFYAINKTTGEVRLIKKFDFETQSSDEFRIFAKDIGGLMDSTHVHVNILNTNDNAPVLRLPEIVYIDSNFNINHPILNVTAFDEDNVHPILSLSDTDKVMFKLIGTELFLIKNVTKGFQAKITITAYDGEDINAYRVSRDLFISTKSIVSPLAAGVICGCIIFFIILFAMVAKILAQKKNYKVAYSNIKRSNRDDVVNNKYNSMKPDYVSSEHDLRIEIESKKNCSDSGRGDSGEEESILVIHDRADYYGSKYCTEDCYKLGHSDSCWLPAETDFGIDVTSKMTNQTNLAVCDRTSDYSSQKSVQNNVPSREVIV